MVILSPKIIGSVVSTSLKLQREIHGDDVIVVSAPQTAEEIKKAAPGLRVGSYDDCAENHIYFLAGYGFSDAKGGEEEEEDIV